MKFHSSPKISILVNIYILILICTPYTLKSEYLKYYLTGIYILTFWLDFLKSSHIFLVQKKNHRKCSSVSKKVCPPPKKSYPSKTFCTKPLEIISYCVNVLLVRASVLYECKKKKFRKTKINKVFYKIFIF